VQRHVLRGANRIERQRQVISDLRSDDVPAGQAEELLDALEATQRQHQEQLGELLDGLNPISGRDESTQEMVQRHVRQAAAHIDKQQQIIARLRADGLPIIARLRADGLPTLIAEQVLNTMLQTQRSHEEHLVRITGSAAKA
jgi:hypothetical protein